MPRALRSKTVQRIRRSHCEMSAESVGWDTWQACAARPKEMLGHRNQIAQHRDAGRPRIEYRLRRHDPGRRLVLRLHGELPGSLMIHPSAGCDTRDDRFDMAGDPMGAW